MRWKVVLAVTAVVVLALLYWGMRVYSPPIAGQGTTASLEQVTLGGDKQWILIRGRDRHAPILLFLHGGPGMPMMYLAYAFQRPLEDKFLIVQWDRRGAGKSYSPDIDVSKMRVSQEIADTISLVQQLQSRFGNQKIILVGHSYGTSLGVRVAKARPDLIRAYVGVGQEGCDRKATLQQQDQWIAARASKRGDRDVVALVKSGRPYDRESLLFHYGGELVNSTSFLDLLKIGLRAPEYSLRDAWNVKAGVNFTHAHLKDDVGRGALMDDVRRLDVPVYFIQGVDDYTSPVPRAVAYFHRLQAPRKRMIWFNHSAHFPFLEEPKAFLAAMERVVSETARQ